MARTTLSIIAAAWLLAAFQIEAGPIAAAAEPSATNSELASLGGLLQALGAGVIGNGALLYPTAPSSHQRAEAEIMASDTATRVLKKVKSILKDGGLNEDEDGNDDSSKSITYMIKPALIFHKEELPPPNPLAGNVLPLPGGALLYTPTPTGTANNEPTGGPAASIKAAYGNLFAASPYTPSYTLNKPHAAVVVEEVTDILSLKSYLQRMEDAGEDVQDDDSDDEDEYGRKRKGKKGVKLETLEFVDSSSTFVNPFTRADFPFGLVTPQPSPQPTVGAANKKEAESDESKKNTARKTIRKTVTAKNTSTVTSSSSSAQISASLGKDGAITVVNNGVTSSSTTAQQGTTIVIPANSLQPSSSSSSSSASPASSASSSSSPAHEEPSKNEDTNAHEITRLAHMHKSSSAKPDLAEATHAKGLRREAATSFDPLETPASGSTETAASSHESASENTGIESLAVESKETASPSVTVGSATGTDAHAESTASNTTENQLMSSGTPKRRKMRIVKVYEVKKNKHSASGETVSIASTSSVEMHKRDVIPIYDAADTEYTAPEYLQATATSPLLREVYPSPFTNEHVSNLQRMGRDEVEDNEDDSDNEDAESDKLTNEAPESSVGSSTSSAVVESSQTIVEETTTIVEAATSLSSVAAESSSASVATASSVSEASSSSAASAESSSASVVSAESSESVAAKEEVATAVSSSTPASVDSRTTVASAAATKTADKANKSTSSGSKSASSSTTSAPRKTKSKSLSIETIGADAEATTSETAVATSQTVASTSESTVTGTTSVSAKSDATSSASKDGKSGSESDEDSNEESDSDSDEEDASGKGKERDDEDESEEESDNEDEDKDTGKGKQRNMRIAKSRDVDEKEGSIRALNRLAALGLREAEKAVLDFEMNSEAGSGIELLTTTDTAASVHDATTTAAAPLAVSPTAGPESSSTVPVRAADDKDADNDSDSDDDSDDEKDNAKASSSKKGESDNDDDSDDSEDDSDSDNESMGKSAGSGSDSGSDSDNEASSGLPAEKSRSTDKPASTTAASKQAEEDAENKAARKALSEALAESAQQAVEVSITELDTAAEPTDGASAAASGFAHDLFSDQEASDELASDMDLVTNVLKDDFEYETHTGVNSNGESVQFVTQLVPDVSTEKARVNETPSIVVMASIDEEYEEEYFSESSTAKPKTSTAHEVQAGAAPTADTGASSSVVQRNVVVPQAMNDVDDKIDVDEKIVRGAEPATDANLVKESQNRAMNIGLGNLRRHV
ncbi:hypothetical protein GGI25_001276 [Coemansia spiralis]|uniref:Uncharacterized protein n=2 Tax=Coemansia TaxID=4863 RepID=A0A9W8L0B6_9FUNG|nr:hypothetical protein EDC05_001350 [Coemansia umbellata]KAJ2624588.1 hypothetical protein GGI26_001281 [Coemansia sp. RSA 1358]KAJ2679824.1 hypothetical protein GGI25_001276 [Coemansia spiralis]